MQTLIHGNSFGFTGGIVLMLIVSFVCFGTFRAKELVQMHKLDKQTVLLEEELNESNKREIKGI